MNVRNFGDDTIVDRQENCIVRDNISQIPQCICPLSHDAPLGKVICIFRYGIFGIWNKYIEGFII